MIRLQQLSSRLYPLPLSRQPPHLLSHAQTTFLRSQRGHHALKNPRCPMWLPVSHVRFNCTSFSPQSDVLSGRSLFPSPKKNVLHRHVVPNNDHRRDSTPFRKGHTSAQRERSNAVNRAINRAVDRNPQSLTSIACADPSPGQKAAKQRSSPNRRIPQIQVDGSDVPAEELSGAKSTSIIHEVSMQMSGTNIINPHCRTLFVLSRDLERRMSVS